MVYLFLCLLVDFQTAYMNYCLCDLGLIVILVHFVNLGDGINAVLGSVGVRVVFAEEPGVVS